MLELKPSKLKTRVRFPSPAPIKTVPEQIPVQSAASEMQGSRNVTGQQETTMQRANDKFDRKQPTELERIPFDPDDFYLLPSVMEAIGWVVMAFAFFCLMYIFLWV